MNPSRSCLVMRPPAPVPFTFEMSIEFSRAIFLTSGESAPVGSGPSFAARRAGASGRGLFGRWLFSRRLGGLRLFSLRLRRATSFINPRDYGIDADGLAFLNQHLRQGSGSRRRDFGIYLIRGNFEERLIPLHAITGLLE